MSDSPELDALREEVRAGFRALAAQLHEIGIDRDRRRLVHLIAGLGDLSFTVRSLLAHAQKCDPELASAIVDCVGSLNGRRVGKLLHRLAGRDFDGWAVQRVGEDREGAVWLAVRTRRGD